MPYARFKEKVDETNQLKAQIARERNPKTAEQLNIRLVQMNERLRQVNPGEPVSLSFMK